MTMGAVLVPASAGPDVKQLAIPYGFGRLAAAHQ